MVQRVSQESGWRFRAELKWRGRIRTRWGARLRQMDSVRMITRSFSTPPTCDANGFPVEQTEYVRVTLGFINLDQHLLMWLDVKCSFLWRITFHCTVVLWCDNVCSWHAARRVLCCRWKGCRAREAQRRDGSTASVMLPTQTQTSQRGYIQPADGNWVWTLNWDSHSSDTFLALLAQDKVSMLVILKGTVHPNYKPTPPLLLMI